MRSIEMGRETLKYVGNTIKEISGIDAAQKEYKEMRTGEGMYKRRAGVVESAFNAAVVGAIDFLTPLYSKSFEDKKDIHSGLAIDFLSDAVIASYAVSSGNYVYAFIAKIGYNTLVRVAPDVAKLAKGRVFQRAK